MVVSVSYILIYVPIIMYGIRLFIQEILFYLHVSIIRDNYHVSITLPSFAALNLLRKLNVLPEDLTFTANIKQTIQNCFL